MEQAGCCIAIQHVTSACGGALGMCRGRWAGGARGRGAQQQAGRAADRVRGAHGARPAGRPGRGLGAQAGPSWCTVHLAQF